MSTGTIYHHLENLSRLIKQKKDKKYYLTDIGLHAYNSMKQNIETIESPTGIIKEFQSPLLRSLMFLTPKRLISFNDKTKLYTLLFSIGILVVGAIFCVLNGYYAFLLFYIEAAQSNTTISPTIQTLLFLIFILNFVSYYIVVEIMCRLFYKKTENTFNFLISFGIIFLPMVLYLILHYIFFLAKIMFYMLIDRILLIFFQVWALWLLTYSLSVNKKLKLENGLIISLLLHYGSFSIILLLII